MNTKILIKPLALATLAMVFAGCDENAWNDHLDGFEDQNDAPLEVVKALEYTLTDADYAAIATNKTNVALAGADNKSALAAVGTRHAFSEAISAQQYVPAFLASTSWPYYALTDGSAVKLTYRVQQGVPEDVSQAPGAALYTVTEDNYKAVWGSDKDYINAFAPSHPASKSIPEILDAAGIELDDNPYCVVSYDVASQEPVFGTIGGGSDDGGGDEPTPPTPPAFEPSSVISSLDVDDVATIQGVVTAVCSQGYMLTDNSGSIFVYCGSSFDVSSQQVGNQLKVEGTIGAYNTGLQVIGNKADVPLTVTVIGQQAVTYPAPKVLTAADLDAIGARTANELAEFVQLTGTVTVSGNYINIAVDGTSIQGSAYGTNATLVSQFTDGAVTTIRGYLIARVNGRYANIVVTDIDGKTVKLSARKRAPRHAAAFEVPTAGERAVYTHASGKWAVASDFLVLNKADYTAMGQKYENLTNAANYLPAYLRNKCPYAQAGDVRNVMYLYYNSSSKETYYMCDQYACTAPGEWTLNDFVVTETSQFVRTGGEWMFDPSVTINLPGGKNTEPSATYYQACVDWVYEHISKPMGSTGIKSGEYYVSSYGNNEYYSGTSAYQGNVDWRPTAASSAFPTLYEGMSDDQIVALERMRFMTEVMPGALAMLHPDAKPLDGIDVLYTINFVVYTGSSSNWRAVFKVTAPATFEPVSLGQEVDGAFQPVDYMVK